MLALVGISLPAFWLGMMLIWIFSVQLRLFPSLAVPSNPLVHRAAGDHAGGHEHGGPDPHDPLLHAGGRPPGLHPHRPRQGADEKKVIRKHALRNALIPVVTVIGLQVGQLLVGAVLTETVFSYPGIGTIMVDAIQRKDTPQILASVVFMAMVFAVVNLLVDILYAFIDPRIKAQYEGSAKRGKGGLLNVRKRA